MLKIVGAKGNIQSVDMFLKKLDSLSKYYDILIQVFDAEVIYGKNHLISAIEHATRAMDRKTNTTNSLAMEILLYASGERQLKIAIPKMGVKKGNTNIAFVFIKESISEKIVRDILKQLSLDRDDMVLQGSINKIKKYGISEEEINTVAKSKYGDLILEKVAMVDIIK
jgi:KEOPS complex subunit Cgi121